MITLNSALRKLIKVDISELITRTHLLILNSFIQVVSVPFLSYLLICCQVRHHLEVHHARKTTEHQYKHGCVNYIDPVEDVDEADEAR